MHKQEHLTAHNDAHACLLVHFLPDPSEMLGTTICGIEEHGPV